MTGASEARGDGPALSIEERRQGEIDRYGPVYWGVMRCWRQDLLRDWISVLAGVPDVTSYLDVGCGKAESLAIAASYKLDARGCEVAPHLCERSDVDPIPGAHDLSRYGAHSWDLVSCNDVLEHLLEEDIAATLQELDRVRSRAVLLGISQKPGPWHICIQSTEWWMERIAENMGGRASIVFADRIKPVKQPYIWVSLEG